MSNQLCYKSLYESCLCHLQTHLLENIPIVDSHCHFDDFSTNHRFFALTSTSQIRKIYMISNKHRYQNWNTVFHMPYTNVHLYETFEMHPKFLDDNNSSERLDQLRNILSSRDRPISGRPIVAIGEIGLDETSPFQMRQ